MRATMKHVAERAGVSIKTVSNVVNGAEHVTPQTRARVQRAIDELGFVPNATARSLRLGRSGVVALALPELSSPYFAELAHHVVRAARSRGWTILVDETRGEGAGTHRRVRHQAPAHRRADLLASCAAVP